MIHVQRNDTCPTVIPRNSACVKHVLIGWKLIFGYRVQRQQMHHTVEWFSTNQNPGYRMSPSSWLIHVLPCIVRPCLFLIREKLFPLLPLYNFFPIVICKTLHDLPIFFSNSLMASEIVSTSIGRIKRSSHFLGFIFLNSSCWHRFTKEVTSPLFGLL